MIKFLKYILFIFIIIYVTDKVIAITLDFFLEKANFRWVNVTKEIPDVYVVGNSRGVNSVNEYFFEKEYDLDLLNLSYNGMSPTEIEYILNFTDKSKLHLIEISSFLTENINDSHEVNRFNPIKHLRNPNRELKNKIFHLLNFNNDLTLRLIYYLFNNDKNWTNNGNLTLEESVLQEKKLVSQEYNLKRLNSFLYYLNKNGFSNVKFYLAPMHPKYISSIKNYDSFTKEIKQLLGDSFINLANILNDDFLFSDLVHNNTKGTKYIHEILYSFVLNN